MKNPIKKLKEIDKILSDLADRDPLKTALTVKKILFGAVISLFSALVLVSVFPPVMYLKENKDFENGKFNASIKEANILSVNKMTDRFKIDVDGNGKFDKGDFSFASRLINKDSKSVVYIDGVGKEKPLAYKRENGEYVIYRDTFWFLENSEDLNKEFYDYMKDKKFFDLAKLKKDMMAHTK